MVRVHHTGRQNETSEAVVLSLVRAATAKDQQLGEHVHRMSRYAAMLGRSIGLEGTALLALHYGALLHDIGKLGIDNTLLHKRGLLTETEQQQIRQHPIIGERIVQPLELASYVGPIIRSHHEHWDGSGYPDRLAGTAIPLGARIIAVIDAFDTFTTVSTRAHAVSPRIALTYLRAGSDRRWDAEVVDALARCIGGIERQRVKKEHIPLVSHNTLCIVGVLGQKKEGL